MERVLRILVALVMVMVVAMACFLSGFATSYLLTGGGVRALPTQPPTQVAPTSTPAPQPTQSVVVPTPPRTIPQEVANRFRLFWEALDVINARFYDPKAIDPAKLVTGAIKGMVDSLGDPNTYYETAEQLRRASEDLSGQFEGIGATIEKRDGRLTIVSTFPGTPAAKAGLKSGDWIAMIDGKDTSGLNAAEGAALIRGPKGTVVTLTIIREGESKPLEFKITRAVINVPNVTWQMVDNQDKIAHVALVNLFTARMTDDLKKTLSEAKTQGAKAIILDLRGNPGGYLNTAIEVASQFLKDGVVAYEQDRSGRRVEFPVLRGGLATDVPLVVLINKGSASASEIVAGAIQDSGRGILIGETTFGKGSVQTDVTLSDGSAIHVTIAHYLTPKGRDIHGVGLTPDIEVKITDDDVKAGRDPQLERAIQYLKTGK